MDFILFPSFLFFCQSVFFYLNQKGKIDHFLSTNRLKSGVSLSPSLRCVLLIFIYKIRMAAINFGRTTVHWELLVFRTPWIKAASSAAQSFSPAGSSFFLLLYDLDDVLVLHDVCEADSLRAVLGTGSLEEQQTHTYILCHLYNLCQICAHTYLRASASESLNLPKPRRIWTGWLRSCGFDGTVGTQQSPQISKPLHACIQVVQLFTHMGQCSHAYHVFYAGSSPHDNGIRKVWAL